jgi:Cu-processing system permease protein
MSAVATIVGYTLRESLRRRVFLVVVLLTVAFFALYGLGTRQAFHDVENFAGGGLGGLDATTLAGATLFGLSMFGTLFLGAVLAIFLTLGVVRGDAERGLLQPLVVRPIGRATFLLSRLLAAGAVCALYVCLVYAGCLLITYWIGGWSPDRVVVIVAALSLLGSVFLSATANGIAIFMTFGAGLVAGLLGQIGEALNSHTLERVATISSWLLPFEALYQDGLNAISADSFGLTRVALQLGPFGGAQAGGDLLWPYAFAYLAALVGLALLGFARRDL